MKETLFLLLAIGTLASCGWKSAGETGCQPTGAARPLPLALRESSGVAWSTTRPDILFSHNDSGHDPVVFAVDVTGSIVGRIPLQGARNRDWEDLATGPCGGASCVYVADVGDNEEVRDDLVVYRFRDSGVFDGSPREVETFPVTLPDGPRDAESIFVLPSEELFLVTKGRSHAVTLYRYPPPLRPGEPVILESVQDLSEGRLPLPQQITGADATPLGDLVVIRSYEGLSFFSWKDGYLAPLQGGSVHLRTLREAQGEGVAFGPGGNIGLTSEAALGESASLTLLNCELRRLYR